MAVTIEFIVEDGTGKADATSYVSLDEFRQYWINRGVDYNSEADAVVKSWLNNATSHADETNTWGGDKSTDTQALEIPRTDWNDTEGNDISGSVPVVIKYGVCELAAAIRLGRSETFVQGVRSKSYSPYSVSYANETNAGKNSYPKADRWFSQVYRVRGLRVCRF